MDGPRKSTACSWLDSRNLGRGIGEASPAASSSPQGPQPKWPVTLAYTRRAALASLTW
ncbi:unnamed protein product [Musa banksii]